MTHPPFPILRTLRLMALPLLVAGCGDMALVPASLGAPEVTQIRNAAPPGAPPGTCWDRDVAPAVVETVTDQILVQPPQISTDGTVRQPAIYRTETRQQIVRERRDQWFRTPCPTDLTPDFNASLQRALRARGLYSGPVSGMMDARTRRAVRSYQREQGLDSAVLSLAAARKLGLVTVDLADSPAPEG
ncbi:peptidoglycan-binding domain-containing protein [Pseudooceanicola aestuarii]|uniref:peptidoglycan-binding domain-containing protein n=1 Tax=Pseudooceanicola aestuarii TaxID=2697319 RepID=UPI0013CF736B|nr:peptidoglycan-binding protein [Pseudooceanicola aestuarii]